METLRVLRSLDVTHIARPLNTEFQDFPTANKIFVCAWAEEALSEDVIVFVDSDTFFVDDPVSLALPPELNVAVRPVDVRGLGSSGIRSINEAYWRELYELCGVRGNPFVRTTVDHKRIRAFFNAGLVAARRGSGIFHAWKEDFLRIMRASHFPRRNGQLVVRQVDQMALATCLAREFSRVRILDESYNYPLHLRAINRSRMASAQLEDLVHVHYHRWFSTPRFIDLVRPKLDPDSEITQWLKIYLPLKPVNSRALGFRGAGGFLNLGWLMRIMIRSGLVRWGDQSRWRELLYLLTPPAVDVGRRDSRFLGE